VSHSDPFEDFLSVSAALTGFSVAQLQGTGMARGYFDELVAIVGDELTLALTREGRLALRWPDDVEEQLRLRVMDDPDLVASEYAVQSAVFFWDRNGLNALADRDDVVGVTRRINGGDNGLAHRRELLNKANGLLAMLDLGAGVTV